MLQRDNVSCGVYGCHTLPHERECKDKNGFSMLQVMLAKYLSICEDNKITKVSKSEKCGYLISWELLAIGLEKLDGIGCIIVGSNAGKLGGAWVAAGMLVCGN